MEYKWWRFRVWPIGKKERDTDSEAARETILGREDGGGKANIKTKPVNEWMDLMA